ncbi:MAG TPA: HAMP domain-containing sensor histidine kinase [Candidatus Acidoferrum sp.]|nr:HAMP domain-containing sensor histidine kinase [Candidatus Acidoferrum sp.]
MTRIHQLEDAVAARDDLIGLIGHELRNPLSPVFLQAYHLLAEVKKNEQGSVTTEWLTPRLELFLRGLERLLDRLNRLMDVAALQSRTGIALVEEDVDLARVVGDVVASVAREAAAAASPLTLYAPVPVMGRWDRLRLEQIAGNLLSNAIRYGAGGAIDVQVKGTGLTAVLTVRDHGPGIAADLQARIFDRFERAGPRPQRGGLGLGLWIARRLCEAMRGTITLESEPGRGAAFVVTLPRGQTEPDVLRDEA